MSNLTLINCDSAVNGSQIRYKRYWYCCNHTLLYIGLEGSMLIENVEIASKSGVAIAVYVKGNSEIIPASPVQLAFTNLKSSSGIFVGPYDFFIAHRTVISIQNSSFNDSYIEIMPSDGLFSEFDVTIKNVSFTSYNGTTLSSMIFRGNKRPFVVKIEEVVISKSMSPYVIAICKPNNSGIHR